MKAPACLLSLALLTLACGTGDPGSRPAAPTADSLPRTAPVADTLFQVERQLAPAERDTLLVDLITYIHRRPNEAINLDRTEARFRPWYRSQLPDYTLLQYHTAEDGTHWFFLARPARSVKGDRRGVGGRFRISEQGRPTAFEEVFNTPVLSMDSVRIVGELLFPELVLLNGAVPRPDDRRLVEWPDASLHYDRERKEWRAVDAPKAP